MPSDLRVFATRIGGAGRPRRLRMLAGAVAPVVAVIALLRITQPSESTRVVRLEGEARARRPPPSAPAVTQPPRTRPGRPAGPGTPIGDPGRSPVGAPPVDSMVTTRVPGPIPPTPVAPETRASAPPGTAAGREAPPAPVPTTKTTTTAAAAAVPDPPSGCGPAAGVVPAENPSLIEIWLERLPGSTEVTGRGLGYTDGDTWVETPWFVLVDSNIAVNIVNQSSYDLDAPTQDDRIEPGDTIGARPSGWVDTKDRWVRLPLVVRGGPLDGVDVGPCVFVRSA